MCERQILNHKLDTEKLMKKIRIVFVEPEIEGNLGSLARAMKNFGLNELFLVNPKIEIGNTARAFAMHASEILDQAVKTNNLDEALENVNLTVGTTAITAKREGNIKRNAIEVKDFAENLVTNYKIAILLGRESSGLTNSEIKMCDFILTIPTSTNYPTMNLSHAATIIFYEIFKTIGQSKKPQISGATKKEKEILIDYFKKMLKEAEIPSHKNSLALRSFRNIVGRSFISNREATILMGVFRRVFGAMKRTKIKMFDS